MTIIDNWVTDPTISEQEGIVRLLTVVTLPTIVLISILGLLYAYPVLGVLAIVAIVAVVIQWWRHRNDHSDQLAMQRADGPIAEELEQIGYLCIQNHPHRICGGCTSACNEPVFAYPEQEAPHG